MRTVWDIPNNKRRDELGHGKHPTQKPLRLLKRMLALSAKEGQLLLSPFAGSGSDCVAAADLGIRFLGFETDPQYVEVCKKRLAATPAVMPTAGSERGKCPDCRRCRGSGEVRWTPRNAKAIPSLVKWTGSKRSQALGIAKLMPAYRRYFEPFLGGGALLYLAARAGSVGRRYLQAAYGLVANGSTGAQRPWWTIMLNSGGRCKRTCPTTTTVSAIV